MEMERITDVECATEHSGGCGPRESSDGGGMSGAAYILIDIEWQNRLSQTHPPFVSHIVKKVVSQMEYSDTGMK